MCGIAGILQFDVEATVSPATVERMCEVIRHRGPDDQGIYCHGPVGLGARRLSIIDLNSGHQPLSNEDGQIWVALNGEVYNFGELRYRLEGQGHHFKTRTDTEVLVHLYEQHGLNFVRHLRGMYAFALWDARAHRLILGRDRLGKKPLYYWQDNGRLAFGSELKCLAQIPGWNPAVNLEALNRYISLRYVPDPDTIVSGVHKLPPAHVLIAEHNRLILSRYWELPSPEEDTRISEEECCQQIRELLSEAVRLRLVSDVPLGALLSGGMDSSSVVGLMSRMTARPVKTFSIGFREKAFSELDYARTVAKHFGAEHHELVVDPNAVQLAYQVLAYFDEPFGDASAIPTYLISQLAREHVTVVLSGDGGDEIFAGYERYPEARRQQVFDYLPRPLRRRVLLPLSVALPQRAYGKNYLRHIAAKNGMERYLDSALMPLAVKEQLVSPEFRSQVSTLDCSDVLRRAIPKGNGRHLVDRLLYLDTVTELPGDIMTKVDRMSMAHSLEVRSPLLDHVFVEYVARLPLRYKLRRGLTKYIFKRAFAGMLPAEILRRPKMGFAIPLRRWFAYEMKDFLNDVLFDSRSSQRGYFRKPYLQMLVQEHASGRRDHSYLLWSLLGLEIWHRNSGL
jgi:asparagine synthase (glutamine-hydrolysing)